jgi:hypothetical protein
MPAAARRGSRPSRVWTSAGRGSAARVGDQRPHALSLQPLGTWGSLARGADALAVKLGLSLSHLREGGALERGEAGVVCTTRWCSVGAGHVALWYSSWGCTARLGGPPREVLYTVALRGVR